MELAASAPAGAGGLVFHPFFAGQVTPYYDATARGAFLGLGLHHNRAELVRAILEGCACEMRLMVDAFDRDLEGGIRELRVTGGGTKSAHFTQIQANVIGRSLGIPAVQECTVLGAAILGAVGAGQFSSVEEAVSAMFRIDRMVEPQKTARALYDDLYALFVEAYERSAEAGINARIYEFQGRYF
jgi:xylulokinase